MTQRFAISGPPPELSARRVMTRPQMAVAFAIFTATILGLAAAPMPTLAILIAGVTLFHVASFAFRLLLAVAGGRSPLETSSALPAHDHLPIYTILVPLYREAAVVADLIAALRALDYPRECLDIKLILEGDDGETIQAVESLKLVPPFETVIVAPGEPRTKPKALNVALARARGAFAVIYDAEDRPESDQLLKAVTRFGRAPARVVCLQARLNVYNASDNWLTAMFALEYALWFDYLLPGLAQLHIPIPLGGTSNHFRIEALIAAGGWDPHNVAEDADLGLRLSRLGYRVDVLDSTTFEEAAPHLGGWVRQRTRWLKGYMQTWLVHMRRPLRLRRQLGARGFWGMQFFVAGTVFSALVNPVFWAMFAYWLATGTQAFAGFYGETILGFALLSLLAGNALAIYLGMLAPIRRGWTGLTFLALTQPAYWLLISVAAARALWQLVRRPWHWEKTTHGLARAAKPEGAA